MLTEKKVMDARGAALRALYQETFKRGCGKDSSRMRARLLREVDRLAALVAAAANAAAANTLAESVARERGEPGADDVSALVK